VKKKRIVHAIPILRSHVMLFVGFFAGFWYSEMSEERKTKHYTESVFCHVKN